MSLVGAVAIVGTTPETVRVGAAGEPMGSVWRGAALPAVVGDAAGTRRVPVAAPGTVTVGAALLPHPASSTTIHIPTSQCRRPGIPMPSHPLHACPRSRRSSIGRVHGSVERAVV